ncbi:hypothetical protein, partial [Streptomyces sp. NPDC059389]|uniref:hypothetical protein n=1 Tax=Streptomyces sp. NPDC059389 TaxID=3346818 RepID=UPI0036BD1F2A
MALRHGFCEIEALARRCEADGSDAHLGTPGGLELARLMDSASGNPLQRITDLYWSVSPAALHEPVDQMRTTLVEPVPELRAAMPDDQQIPTPDQMDHALHVVVHGDRARINVTAAQSSGRPAATSDRPMRTKAPSGPQADAQARQSWDWPRWPAQQPPSGRSSRAEP